MKNAAKKWLEWAILIAAMFITFYIFIIGIQFQITTKGLVYSNMKLHFSSPSRILNELVRTSDETYIDCEERKICIRVQSSDSKVYPDLPMMLEFCRDSEKDISCSHPVLILKTNTSQWIKTSLRVR